MYCVQIIHLAETFIHKGRPSSSVYGDTINIEVESTEDTPVVEDMVSN